MNYKKQLHWALRRAALIAWRPDFHRPAGDSTRHDEGGFVVLEGCSARLTAAKKARREAGLKSKTQHPGRNVIASGFSDTVHRQQCGAVTPRRIVAVSACCSRM
jgi:hypothetical protein